MGDLKSDHVRYKGFQYFFNWPITIFQLNCRIPWSIIFPELVDRSFLFPCKWTPQKRLPKFVQNSSEEPHVLSYVFSGVWISLLCKNDVIWYYSRPIRFKVSVHGNTYLKKKSLNHDDFFICRQTSKKETNKKDEVFPLVWYCETDTDISSTSLFLNEGFAGVWGGFFNINDPVSHS